MIVTRKKHRLAVRYNHKDKDTYADCSPRFGNGDLRYILDVLNKEVLAELERRGFDLKTMRFQIDKTAAAIQAHEERVNTIMAQKPLKDVLI